MCKIGNSDTAACQQHQVTMTLHYSMTANRPPAAMKKDPALLTSAVGLLFLQAKLLCADLYIK